MKTKLLVSALLLSLLSGCITGPVIREPVTVERVIVVREYHPAPVWSFGFVWGRGHYHRHGPWRR
jgi:hypothetical protein